MKKIITIIGLAICLVSHVNAQTESTGNTLENIEDKVLQSFLISQQTNDAMPLQKLNQKLETLYATKKQNIIRYWQSYTKYYTAIFYLTKGNKELSEKNIGQAVEYLESIKNKTSEDYALLAINQGFAIQFKNTISKIFLSRQIKKNGELAIEKGPQNLRAYYALASNDFYTPEQYGGGKSVENYLLKALALPSQKVKNSYLPSWGKENCYQLLVKWYAKKEKWEKAKSYCQEAISAYPEKQTFKQLYKKLENK